VIITVTILTFSAGISGGSLFRIGSNSVKMGALGVSHAGTAILGHKRTVVDSGSKRVMSVRRGGAQWRASLKSGSSGVVPDVKKDVGEQELVQLGQSSVMVSKIGIGAWSWGDRLFWNDSWDGMYTHFSLHQIAGSLRM
jgi:hypothetical protein